MLILTSIDKVYLNFNTDMQQGIDVMTVSEALKHIDNHEFASGSMLPKVKACIEFVKSSNKKAIITSLEQADKAFLDGVGTKIIGGN